MAKFVKAPAYRVLVDFKDFKTGIKYKAGDEFPVSTGVTRLQELLAEDNDGRTSELKGKPIIEAVETESDEEAEEAIEEDEK
jgi:hypothetical protein